MAMDRGEVGRIVLETLEASLELQLRAVRQMMGTEEMPPPVRVRRGLRKESLVSLSAEILRAAGRPMRISEIRDALLREHGRVTDANALSGAIGRLANGGELFERAGRGLYVAKGGR